MGLKDFLSRRSDSTSGSADPQDVPRGDEPGASTTQYDDGRGTVGLGDRLGGAAPDTNQGKAEPMPPTPGHADPEGTGPHTNPPQVPELDDMSAGAAAAQIASPPGLSGPTAGSGGPRPRAVGEVASRLAEGAAAAALDPASEQPVHDVPTGSSTGSATGPQMPESQTTGTAFRANGQQGLTPDGENVESDTQLGADRMVPADAPDRTGLPTGVPGDSHGVNVPHELPAPGTSEEQGVVHGVKDPAT